MASEELETLRQEATELGITFKPNMGAGKLQELIDAYYESQETSGKEIEAAVKAVEAKEKSEESSVVNGNGKKTNMAELARKLYEEAMVTKVVTIIDNDQRVNNQTTTAKANWTNNYYDMGSRIFPLNTPIEIPVGYINVLKEVLIPMHTRDAKSGLAVTTMRPRYTIAEENK